MPLSILRSLTRYKTHVKKDGFKGEMDYLVWMIGKVSTFVNQKDSPIDQNKNPLNRGREF